MNTILITLIVLLIIIAAIANAVMDTLQFHYHTSVFKKRNQLFWNPRISWRNKYKKYPTDKRAKFPFAKTALVFLTDAWHLFQFIMLSSFTAAIVVATMLTIEGGWFGYVAVFISMKVVFGLVFEFFFGTIFKQKKQS